MLSLVPLCVAAFVLLCIVAPAQPPIARSQPPQPPRATHDSTAARGSLDDASERALLESGKPKPVARVDLPRYMGRWYEIARYPNRYQDGLVGVIANYTLRPDGKIDVRNVGRRGKLDGPEAASSARGWSICSSNARWHVQFVWPFRADYWIIDLEPDYRYAVVGQPCRTHLWILSRTPKLDEKVYEKICKKIAEHGYDPARLVRTPQP